MTTVGSLAYGIVANTSNFTVGVAGTKAELRDLKAAFLASQSPVERYSSAIEHLEGLAAKFPEKGEALRRTIGQMRTEMSQAQFASSALGQAMSKVGIVVDPVSASFRAFQMASGLVTSALHAMERASAAVFTEMERLNEVSQKAKNLGISSGSLVGLRGAAEDLGNVKDERFDNSLAKFGENIGQAAMDRAGPAFDALQRLGIDAKELSGLSLDKAFLRLADALQKVDNIDERLALSKGLLGKGGAELASALAAGGDEIRRLSEEQQKLSQTKFIDDTSIKDAIASVRDLKDGLQGVVSITASEFAPVVADVSKELTAALMGASGEGKEFRSAISDLATSVARLTDRLEAAASALNTINPLGSGVGSQITSTAIRAGLQGVPGGGLLTSGYDAASTLGGLALSPGDGPGRHEAALAKAREALEINKQSAEVERQTEIAARASEAEEKAAKAAALKADEEQFAEWERQTRAHLRDIKLEEDARAKQYHEAQQFAESLKTPSEKLGDQLEQLKEWSTNGFLDPETLAKGIDNLQGKAKAMLPPEIRDITPQSVQAVRAGSVEALRAQYNGKGGTSEKQLEEQRKQRQEQERATKFLEDIAKALPAAVVMEAS